jgi:hypothetical protein
MLSALPPLPRPSVQTHIDVVNDPDGDYFRNHGPTRWWRAERPPPWPVDRWWRFARGLGLDAVHYDWETMPDALFADLG